MTNLRHFDSTSTARFVTFSTYKRIRALEDDVLKQIVIDELKTLRATHGIKILGYVIMPDHIHLILQLPEGLELGRIIGQLKSKSARKYFAMKTEFSKGETRILWLRRCYDHNCRDTRSIIEKINYCHNNPSKKGLVREPSEWKWSSCGWYEGRRDGPLEIDAIEI